MTNPVACRASPHSPSGVAEFVPDDQIWDDFETAMQLGDTHDDNFKENDQSAAYDASQYVAQTHDGDFHVCGPRCKHLYLNEDRCYVCGISGFVFGRLSLREDYSTGRQAGSSDPDAHAGEPVGGQWKVRANMKSLSNQAYNAAENVDEAACETVNKRKEVKQAVKRGARCVDEVQSEAPKRPRTSRCVPNGSRQQLKALADEAEHTLARLINFDKKIDPKSKTATVVKDSRLLDPAAIFQAGIKKYIKECVTNGVAPALDAIHNIGITAQNIAAEERRKQQISERHAALIMRVQIRQQVTALAVALWQACCGTSYMINNRRGADSFRPFVCGMLYALKRGVELPDGTPVVPCSPTLAEALPALRATAANSMAKALHASSHRGLCTLHRCISSCTSNAKATRELFNDAARLSQQINNTVASGAYGF